jgi:hypothetical protein
MTNSIRFYNRVNKFLGKDQMEILTMEEVIKGERPDLAGAPRMLSIGLQAGEQELFQQDILSLKIDDVPEDSNFWRQEIGKVMKEKEFDECVIHFYETKLLLPEYVIYLKRNGKFGSHNTVTGRNSFSEGTLFEPKYSNLQFPVLLTSNGAKVIGNGIQDKNLLPSQETFDNEMYC